MTNSTTRANIHSTAASTVVQTGDGRKYSGLNVTDKSGTEVAVASGMVEDTEMDVTSSGKPDDVGTPVDVVEVGTSKDVFSLAFDGTVTAKDREVPSDDGSCICISAGSRDVASPIVCLLYTSPSPRD